MNITAKVKDDIFCCGVQVIGSFANEEEDSWNDLEQEVIDQALEYNPAFITATFINNPVCKKAYEILRSKLKLIRQTKPRMNEGSGNKVFMCIYVPRKD
jgi:hypothetical protein